MIKLFSYDWACLLQSSLLEHEDYQKSAAGFDSSMQFVIHMSQDETRTWGINLPHCDDVWGEHKEEVDFIMEGPFEVFDRIKLGELEPVVAISTGQIKFKGNVLKILKYAKATALFIKAMGDTPGEV
ncbi:MAG: hypothetical protein HOE90_03405 [Bacteriovoracaceae bacterium]|jgi:putative sterol carrier protein|nr:hypothetical protein [Bacteriovoracaceae bacterium]